MPKGKKTNDVKIQEAINKADETGDPQFVEPQTETKRVVEVFARIIDEEDMENNPFLSKFGVKVGDLVRIPHDKIDHVPRVKTTFEVINSDGGLVRTYTFEAHGENAETLANQYAAKINGKVK
jgi:hypothetical protein